MQPYILLAAAGVLALDAAAQDANTLQPGNPAARVPPTTYQSAFESYVPWRDPQLASWRQVNDAVGAIGGHSGIVGGEGTHMHPSGVGAKSATQSPAREVSGSPRASQAPARDAPKAPADDHGHGRR